MDQYIGKLLDNRYELLERIGTGGMAVVYKARCHRLNRLVAVKILKPELAEDAEFRRRFHDESQAVAMLSHPNIVAVYDVSSSDDLNYIVMELIDGITLKQYMQKRGTPLNWREALHFITQIIRALGHAHSRGIIHRDIKPHNIMVLRDGSVKVADFGIARLTSGSQSTLTQEALGSVHYISPEQARGSRIDGRSDLYSAGVVLYEMITGRLPFEGDTPVSVAIQHINSIPIPPRELNPDIPEALEEITLKAMAPNVDQRYASADEMLADLEEFRKNPNISFEYTPAEFREMEDESEPTQIVSTAHIRAAENEDSIRRRRQGESVQRRREESYQEEPYDYEEPRRRRGVSPALIAVGVIILFVAGIVAFLWNSFFSPLFSPASSHVVPNLLDMTLEEIYADDTIMSEFRIETGDTVFSEEYDAGKVMDQSPSANTTVTGERPTITVTISGGPDTGTPTMPTLTGADSRVAQDTLETLSRSEGLNLVIQVEEENSESVNEGYVTRTDPAAGSELSEGQTVTIYESIGKETEPTTVPLLEGQTVENARRMLEEANLVLGETRSVSSETVEADLIVFQDIRAGQEVEAGTVINVQVSTGPANPDASESPSDSGTTNNPSGEEPSQSVGPTMGNATVTVNLSGYEGNVQVRILVGGSQAYNKSVSAATGTLEVTVSGSGTQRVEVYCDGQLVDSYDQAFTE